jgi:Ca2+-binding EF-hand superfamily protein
MHRFNKGRRDVRKKKKKVGRVETMATKMKKMSALASLDVSFMTIFRNIFDRYDDDHSGLITGKDILPIMKELGLPHTNIAVQNIIYEMNADGNAGILFDEFAAVMATKMIFPYSVEKVKEACGMFDDNLNGKLKREDVMFAMEELVPHPMSHEETDHMLLDLFGPPSENTEEMDINVFLQRIRKSLCETSHSVRRNEHTLIDIYNSRKMESSGIQNEEGTTGENKEESSFAAEKNPVLNSNPTLEPFNVKKATEINVGQAK